MAVPTLVAGLYYGLIASDQYVAEARLLVRGGGAAPMLRWDRVLQSLGLGAEPAQAYAVADYVLSRDALQDINQQLDLARIWGRPDADLFSRFPRPWDKPSFEGLFADYTRHVQARLDRRSGILTLRISAFQPRDAADIAQALVNLAEARVNRINGRAAQDASDGSARDLALAEVRLHRAQDHLSQFRVQSQNLDPARVATTSLQEAARLQAEHTLLAAQLEQTERAAPRSPSPDPMRRELAALQTQIRAARAGDVVQGAPGTTAILPAQIETYGQLALQVDLAEQRVRAATTAHLIALQSADHGHIYLDSIVAPHAPDEATEPHRLRSVGQVLAAGFLIQALVWIMVTGVREHAP